MSLNKFQIPIKNLCRFFLLMGLILFAPVMIYAEIKNVKGIVVDESGESLIGATVKEKGTANVTVTNFEGVFNLKLTTPKPVLEITYMGYETATYPVKTSQVKVVMKVAEKLLDETVVVAYGTQRKVTVTGSVASIGADDIKKSSAPNITAAIAGRLPGLTTIQTNGAPGKDEVTMFLRGAATYNDKKPLILVDGRETSMDAFDKMDKGVIESVSVLKDSASIRLYGKRGANGVILVSTQKNGKLGNDMKAVAFIEKETVETNTAEEIAVTGTVVDEQRRPKAGVSVVVPNTNIGTMTDANGRFQLKTQNRGSIWFSFIGYKTVKAPVSPTMSVQLEQEVVRLFPETSGKLKASATLSSDVKGIRGLSIHGIKDGEPPLVIIDGKEALEEDALSKLSPDRIKSFSILKDKSAETVYGEKGKNGVIIVTLLTEGEYDFQKANSKKPYADALELAESVAKDVEGEIIYCINDEEVKKKKLKGMSTKTINSVSLDHFDKKKIVRLKTEKYRSDWVPVVGVVKDADGKRIAASIRVKGANDITRTNTDGSFAIRAPKNGVLLVGDNNQTAIEVKVKPILEAILKD